ncbi:MAG: 4-hydroxythreonine-4-phosphate dehydrogenase PdxA, partial [Gemmataceae bacterium]|nr:4-hydroxythreonine-4-phosphate dehydrogenase PdxA [Gemmataceae bacterium]
MGDPAGVGPELCLRLLDHDGIRAACEPVVYGDLGILRRVATHLGCPGPDPARVLELTNLEGGYESTVPGRVSAACGAAAYEYVTRAIDDALAGRVDAIATGPLHKEALHAAGVPFPGHTEILASRTKAARSCMMLTSGAITCSLVTVHVGYREVPELLTTQGVLDTIELTRDAMRRIRDREPRLLVCGLNPHAGEHGLFGAGEEERVI